MSNYLHYTKAILINVIYHTILIAIGQCVKLAHQVVEV